MTRSAWLTGLHIDGQPGEWPLAQEAFVIGREAPADLIVPIARVSRQQARITRLDRAYFIADLNSRNGTFVNGRAIGAEPQRLSDGDEIVIAGVAAFHFNDPGETMSGPRLGRLRGVWIDEAARMAWVDGQLLEPDLSNAQFTLLRLLYNSIGQVVTREDIIAAVWPDADPAGVSEEAVDGLIKRLRARLRAAQPQHDYIEAVRGHGLRLIAPE